MSSEPSAPPVRWGVIGTGVVARGFAEDLALVPGAVLSAVASRDPERGRAFAAALAIARVHQSVEALALDESVDVVYVASPHDRHRDHATRCLSAGKAVLCEKPLALNGAECREIIAQARSSGRFCMEAMWMRFQPLVLKARELARSGELGQIRLLTADFGYPTPFHPESRFFDPAKGGGTLLDRGVYLLSLAHFLLGPPADALGFPSIGSAGVDEQSAITLRYDGGALAVLTASLRSRLRNEATIIGTKGRVVLHDPFYAPRRMTLVRHDEPEGQAAGPSPSPSRWKTRLKRSRTLRRAFETLGRPALRLLRRGTTFTYDSPGHGYEHEAAEVVRCIRAGMLESPLIPLDESQRILDLMDRLRQSWGLAFPGEGT